MAACFVCPWGFHFLASELPRRHLIMFGFSFNSFLLISTFFWWPCFYSYSFMSQQNLSNKRNFPEHFHLEFSGFFRGSMPFIAAVLFLIKKNKKTRQELMGRLRQAAVDAGQPEKLLLLRFSWLATYEQRMTRRKGRKKLGGLRTSKKTLEYFKNWKEQISPANTMASWIFGT